MGKSGKKSKSDKINALRKQYDAFLEEDKKRKDRNEYILGRMETMRSCTTLVHVRSKAYPKIEESVYPTQPKYKSAIALSTHVIPKYLNKNYDEPSVLREISKKYFLIPKVISNDLYNVNYKENDHDPSPNDDWKSKYNILEELKREEKGDLSKTTTYENQSNLNDIYDNKNAEYIPLESNDTSFVQNNRELELTPTKLKTDMFSNNKLSHNNLEVKPNRNNEKPVEKILNGENIDSTDLNMKKQELVPQLHKLHEVKSPSNSSPKVSQVANNIKQDIILPPNNNEMKETNELPEDKPTSKMEAIESVENKKYVPEEKKSIEFNEPQNNTVHYPLSNANNNLSPIVNIENSSEVTNENTNEVNNQNTMVVNHENTMKMHNANALEINNENNAFSVNVEDNQEFVQNEDTVRAQGVYEEEGQFQDDPAIDITGHQEYQLQESDLNQIPNVEQNVNSEVNDELETEQKEMYYVEDNVKNNEYNEHDSTEYPAENENYVNQEYSYYDESQKEQIYPTDINEHEESTERYDPNYEQQYVNNYDDNINTEQYQPDQYVENSYEQQQNMYDQQQGVVNYQTEDPNYEYAPTQSVQDAESNQNVYYTNLEENPQYEAQQVENSEIDQQNIAYPASEDYDAQQEYITMHAEPQQIENVEQKLDVEDGYIPNPDVVAENPDYKEIIIGETTPEIQETDIKVT